MAAGRRLERDLIDPVHSAIDASTVRPGPDQRLVLYGALAVAAALFFPTLLGFHDVWTRQPYTHGYLVLAAVVWLAWRDRGHLAQEGAVWTFALPLALVLSSIWLVAHVTHTRVLEQATLPLLLLLWVAMSLGGASAARMAPLAAISLLAVPAWEVLTSPLQAMTVAATRIVVGLAGIPATIEGNIVNVPSGSFLIEGGCAGLNYFMAALVIGAVYGQAFLRAWQARVAAVAFLAGMSVLGNWFRVSSLVGIGHVTEMQSTLMDGHLMYGWVIFAVGLLASLLLSKRFEAWEARRWPATEAAPGVPGRDATLRGATIRARRVVLGTAVVVLGPLLYFAIDLLPVRPVPTSAVGVSATWLEVARGERPFAWRPAFQGADEEVQVSFTSGTDVVVLDRFVYRSQGQQAELIGFSSRIAPDDAVVFERLFGQIGPERRLVNEAIVRDDEGHVLVWYWYRVAGIETSSAARAKALELWAFLTRATTSELIAVSAPCARNDCSGAARALSSFFGA